MFTEDGLEWLGAAMETGLTGAMIRITNGTKQAEAAVESVAVEDQTVVLKTTFGEQDANFEWSAREVVVNGTVIDRDEEDGGRKVAGSIWEAEVRIDLAAG